MSQLMQHLIWEYVDIGNKNNSKYDTYVAEISFQSID